MTTPYFTKPADLAPVTKARSVDINNLSALIAQAFANIPNYSQTWTGTHDFTGGLMRVAAPVGNTDAATKAYVDAVKSYADTLAFRAGTLPNQAGNAGKLISTDGTNVFWKAIASMQRSPRIANVQLVAADLGALVDITAGTFTQTFDTPANLGAGWMCYVKNSGTGNITIPLSDSIANWIMYPNEVRLFMCDGNSIYSIVLHGYKMISQISGTWIKPPGYNYHRERLTGGGQGGGGGGSGGSGMSTPNLGSPSGGGGAGGSGGAGGCPGVTTEVIFPDAILPNSVAYTVGAGGVGGAGGAASLGVLASANGNFSGNPGTAGAAGNVSTFGTVGAQYYVTSPGGAATANGGAPGNGTAPPVAATNATAVAFSMTTGGITTIPVSAAGPAATSLNSTSSSTPSPGTAGGNGGPGGVSTPVATAAPGGAGGAATAGVATTPGNAGSNAPAVPANFPGAGGGGGGGGSGSTGCGTAAPANVSPSGIGGRGADGAAGQFEMAGII